MTIYAHTSVRVKNAAGKTTTVSIPDELLMRLTELANGDIELVRRKCKELARKHSKSAGMSFSIQVRQALEKTLRGHHKSEP